MSITTLSLIFFSREKKHILTKRPSPGRNVLLIKLKYPGPFSFRNCFRVPIKTENEMCVGNNFIVKQDLPESSLSKTHD